MSGGSGHYVMARTKTGRRVVWVEICALDLALKLGAPVGGVQDTRARYRKGDY